jgi:hypothetical protein
VTQALEDVSHVQSVSTNYKEKKSIVKAKGDGCSLEGEERLVEAIHGIGYQAKVLSNLPR